MNLKNLQTFVTICECGTVSRAATKLRITQPALSRRIKALQEELGLTLFENSGRRLLLTREGEEFLRHSRALLGQADAVLATGRALGSGRAGILRVGGAPHTLAALFPSFVAKYEKQNPGVRVRLFEAGAAKLLTMIEQGELHFAITSRVGSRPPYQAADSSRAAAGADGSPVTVWRRREGRHRNVGRYPLAGNATGIRDTRDV